MIPSWITHTDVLSQIRVAGSFWRQQEAGQHVENTYTGRFGLQGGCGGRYAVNQWKQHHGVLALLKQPILCVVVAHSECMARHVYVCTELMWTSQRQQTFARVTATAIEANPPASGTSLRKSLRVVLYPPGSGTSPSSQGITAAFMCSS